jgi:hypothetical protein
MRILTALTLLFPLTACATLAPGADVEALAGPMLADAASQVQRCYRPPRVGHSVRQIVTTVRVRMTETGNLDGLPTVVAQHNITPATRPFAGRMAEAAIGAVMRCAPLRLPSQYYQGVWREFDLTFSPRASA